MKLKELYETGKTELIKAGVPDGALDAWYLLETAASVTRSDLYVHGDREIPAEKEKCYLEYLDARKKRIPLQRILGEQEFMGIPFRVGKDALIPRQDTETLVEEALSHVESGNRILDMCTGTGCIAISLLLWAKKQGKTGIVMEAADLSREALAVAAENARLQELTRPEFTLIQSDLFEEIRGRYQMIVSNPPYITPEELETLEPEVRDHDPYMALYGGEDGLDFYRRITAGAAEHLEKDGYLFYEIGCEQAEAVSGILADNGFEKIRVLQDLSGRDRVVTGQKV